MQYGIKNSYVRSERINFLFASCGEIPLDCRYVVREQSLTKFYSCITNTAELYMFRLVYIKPSWLAHKNTWRNILVSTYYI